MFNRLKVRVGACINLCHRSKMEKVQHRSYMQSQFLTLHGVPTHVLKCGDVKKGNPSGNEPFLAVIIPGNPGIVGYYEEFMDKLYTLSNKRLPVWAVSHAGHVKIPKELEIQASAHDPFNLEGQIQHKMDFLRNHVPKDVNIILIGHSIGCYIILQLVNRLPDLNIHRAIMLFPTIERMALSPQGRIATPFLRYFRWIARGAAYFLSFLPQNLQRKLIIWHLADDNLPECAIESTLNLVDHFCLGNVMYMANTEMNEVTDLHVDIIRAHLKKLTFYMGLTDAWCPVEYYEGMKERFPDGDIKLCQVGYEHAFVLTASEPVAQLTWSWLEKDVSEKIDAD
ncbi:lipid droplet-associated hydrolase-like [Lingula anatina]|uniref:Lipid droplet-associated hydrolase n=1 Tax=Lingula anatina TaxID=7574 RepID=A0A1S3JT04_LINAN|nr:lipid droplet-associated hydrolase-like [Lingula anatina]|eukprot:XP_013413468.1 lipid droplet-associated hydrolase-like [Lingula anatina]